MKLKNKDTIKISLVNKKNKERKDLLEFKQNMDTRKR